MSKCLVIGNSISALVTANYLADASHQLQLLEVHPARTDLLHTQRLDAQVIQELGLSGFELRSDSSRFASHQDGTWVRASRSQLEGDVTQLDQQRWPQFVALLDQASILMRQSYLLTTATSHQATVADAWRELDSSLAKEILRLPWISLKDLLNEWFDSDVLKGLLCHLALQNCQQGPFASGTGFGLVHAWATGQALEQIEIGNLDGVLRQRLQTKGATFHQASSGIQQLVVEDDQVRAVLDGAGQNWEADLFFSGYDARKTFIDWVPVAERELALQTAVSQARYRGSRCLIEGRLEAVPNLPNATPQDWLSGLVFTAGLNGQEKAYDPTKYGGHSPALLGQFYFQDGTLNAKVGYHPYRQSSRSIVTDLLKARGFDVSALACYLPEDLEAQFGWSQGSELGEELCLSQANFLRPFASYQPGDYPFLGLHLCGPSVHPGDAAGLSARLAAQSI
jgi:phytoene dehydrogenase-like protein